VHSDDEATSDPSGVGSERSHGSRNGGAAPGYLDVAEVLNHCASTNWTERKEGLLGLQGLLRGHRALR